MRRIPLSTSLAIAAVMAAAGSARGQAQGADEGPVIVGERKQGWRAFELKRFGADIELLGTARTDKLKATGQPDMTDRENRLRETLNLNFESYIGHQYLIDLTGTFGLRLEQRRIDTGQEDTSGSENDFNNIYDIHALMLGNSFVPVDVYTRREESQQDRAFASSLTTIVEETGAVASIQSEWAPTTLRIFQNDTDQSDDFGDLDYHQKQQSFAGVSNIRFTDDHQLEVNYTFDRVNQTQSDGFGDDFDRNDLSLTDTYTFGGDKHHQLRSYLRYFDQTGRADQETLRWDEQLQLHHSERLDTYYNLSAEQRDIQGVEQWLGRADAGFRHKLFDSLVTTGTFGGQTLSYDDFQSDELFVTGGLDYTKQVPYGRLDMGLAAGYTAQSNSERGSTFDVLDEPHVYNDPFPIVISRRQVVPGSVSVSALGGFPVYTEGVDYTVQYFPDRAEIQPIIGRGISNRQTVLIDYTIGPEPSSEIDTVFTSTSVRYTVTEGKLTGVAVYGRYRTRDPSLSTSDPSRFVLEELTDLLYGIEYRRWGVLLRAEQEMYDSSVNPYDLTRLQAGLDYRFSPDSVFTLDAIHEIIDYTSPANSIILDRVTGQWNQRLTREFDFALRVGYRMEQNDLSGDSEGFDQFLEFRWHRGRTTVFGNIRNDLLYADESDTTSQSMELGLRRVF
ncbi:MAG: hypothetical protein IT436_04760 [Phycisphaerales bacterium]|nr:hypothetical protein [Phycisphaerales bacterium]